MEGCAGEGSDDGVSLGREGGDGGERGGEDVLLGGEEDGGAELSEQELVQVS